MPIAAWGVQAARLLEQPGFRREDLAEEEREHLRRQSTLVVALLRHAEAVEQRHLPTGHATACRQAKANLAQTLFLVHTMHALHMH